MEYPYLYYTTTLQDESPRFVANELSQSYHLRIGGQPDISLYNSWEKSIELLKGYVHNGLPILIEYVFPIGMQRADFVIIGHNRAHVVEIKGWNKYAEIDDFTADTEMGEKIQPCYQLDDYLYKFKYFHSASKQFEFTGSVLMYNTKDGDRCDVVYDPEGLMSRITVDKIGRATEVDVKSIVNGKFEFSETLVNFIRNNRDEILKGPKSALVSRGFGLSEDQMIISQKIQRSIARGEKKVYLVRGKMGSGKTLVAITALFDAISRNQFGLLAYKNNRLINTLRRAFGSRTENLLRFYSVGFKGGNKGVGEKFFDELVFNCVS